MKISKGIILPDFQGLQEVINGTLYQPNIPIAYSSLDIRIILFLILHPLNSIIKILYRFGILLHLFIYDSEIKIRLTILPVTELEGFFETFYGLLDMDVNRCWLYIFLLHNIELFELALT